MQVNIVGHAILALVYAGILIMLTIGLNMVYSVLKFSNFAQAEYVTSGMFASWWFLQILSNLLPSDTRHFINNLFIQAMFAFVIVGILGILGEILVYDRLRMLRASPSSWTVASIGIGLIIRNTLSMVFGDFPRPNTVNCPTCTSTASLPGWLPKFLRKEYYTFELTETQMIRITVFELYIILMSFLLVIIIDYIFTHTKFGIAMRATSDSMELAQVSGIDTKRIVYYTWFLAAGITGFGAAFVRANQPRFSTYDGFYLLLPIFAVVILGGVGSFRGGIIAAFLLAYARQLTVIVFTEFQKPGGLESILEKTIGFTITFTPAYAEGIGFIVLIIVLLLRPQGILGTVEATRARV
ncbi:MAG: branched-chain amino acid ABC transporter permease [Candidatus Heimdallarchaeota archaeon]